MIDAIYERFGRLDVLVNNAGMSPLYDSVQSVSEELFDKVIDVNLKGPFRLAAVAGERMVQAGGGGIINISSAGAVHPRPHILPYAAAKAGLNALPWVSRTPSAQPSGATPSWPARSSPTSASPGMPGHSPRAPPDSRYAAAANQTRSSVPRCT